MSDHDERKPKASGRRTPGRDLHGAAVIDEDGHETPITEAMIQQALAELERAAARSRDRKS